MNQSRSRLRALPAPTRLGLSALLVVGLTGWAVALHLAARTGPGSLWDALSPEATRLRVCAPPLERAIGTNMREHIPDPGERAALRRWMHRGTRMDAWFERPSRIVARRCGSCHGQAPQAGVRLLTYHDARSLASPKGRDPYHRLQHLHVHLFAVGAVLGLLLLGLGFTRLPPWLVRAVGLGPVAALLLSVPLVLFACQTRWAPYALWLADGVVVLGWLAGSLLLLWDLWAAEPNLVTSRLTKHTADSGH